MRKGIVLIVFGIAAILFDVVFYINVGSNGIVYILICVLVLLIALVMIIIGMKSLNPTMELGVLIEAYNSKNSNKIEPVDSKELQVDIVDDGFLSGFVSIKSNFVCKRDDCYLFEGKICLGNVPIFSGFFLKFTYRFDADFLFSTMKKGAIAKDMKLAEYTDDSFYYVGKDEGGEMFNMANNTILDYLQQCFNSTNVGLYTRNDISYIFCRTNERKFEHVTINGVVDEENFRTINNFFKIKKSFVDKMDFIRESNRRNE